MPWSAPRSMTRDLMICGDDEDPAGPPRRDRLEPRRPLAGAHRPAAERRRPGSGPRARRPPGGPAGSTLLYSSDLARARETAAAVEARHRPRGDRSTPSCARSTSASWVGCTREQARERDPELVPGVASTAPSRATAAARRTSSSTAARCGRSSASSTLPTGARPSSSATAATSAPSSRRWSAWAPTERWRVAGVANCSLTAIERRHGRITLVTFNETGSPRLEFRPRWRTTRPGTRARRSRSRSSAGSIRTAS